MTAEHPEDYQTDKEKMREAFVTGYLQGYGVEEPSRINKRTAEKQFETWYNRNYGGQE